MAKRTEGFDEAILQCAKQEFLEKGYEAASLRTIAKNASVSTSTIYTRFTDKAGLFKALVSPAADELLAYMRDYLWDFSRLDTGIQAEHRLDYSIRGYRGFLDILYAHFDEFKLMITSSTNDFYRSFLEKIVVLDTQCTIRFLEAADNPAYREGRITEGFIRIVSAGFFSGVFEIAVHNISREEGEKYVEQLRDFYNNGWNSYL